MTLPTKQDLLDAKARIQHIVHKTPVLTSSTFNKLTGAEVYFKCENFQRMGAYKMRGASNALSQLSPEQRNKGVVTHSSGNFGQAIALAAMIHEVKAKIVMPENTPVIKVDAVKGYGADILFTGPKPADREQAVNEVIQDTGMVFIHPSNDLQVILGNSSCAQEFIEEIPELDLIIVPVGGGGLLAGTALAAHWFSRLTEVWAAEPENVDDAFRSLQSGKIEINERADTMADGLRTHLGNINFPIIKELVNKVLLVSEDEIQSAMWWIWERMKIVIEPSSAVAVAAALRYHEELKGKRVGIILSGGNTDIRALALSYF